MVDNSSALHFGGGNYSLSSDPIHAGQEVAANEAFDHPANTSRPSVPLPSIAMTITVSR